MATSNLVTMAKAAELVSMKRPTFYRKVKELNVSTVIDDITKKKMVDVSELMRVFGDDFKLNQNEQQPASKASTDKKKTVQAVDSGQNNEIEIIKLKAELEKEKALRQSSEETVDYLKQQIELEKDEKKKLNLLLTDQRDKPGQSDAWTETLKKLEARIANQEKAAEEKARLEAEALAKQKELEEALEQEEKEKLLKEQEEALELEKSKSFIHRLLGK